VQTIDIFFFGLSSSANNTEFQGSAVAASPVPRAVQKSRRLIMVSTPLRRFAEAFRHGTRRL
jgi:hypothetical protein